MEKTKNDRDPNGFHAVVRLGLERIGALLEELGRPDRKLKFVHVAGTNGKGSVCAFLEAALFAAGKHVGKFTSPNLVRVNERICVDMRESSDVDLEKVLSEAEAAASRIEQNLGEYPTQFEIWCAAAMLYFAYEKCDIVVLEVGLGGEFDATNVIEKCEIAVICHIDIDHTAYLGNTIAEIATAKCGIMKKNITSSHVVTCEQSPQAMNIIKSTAREYGHMLEISPTPTPIENDGIHEYYTLGTARVKLSLAGEYQLANAALAHRALNILGIDDSDVKRGLETAVHKGRFEEILPGVIFDGGHNPDGVSALCRSLDKYYPNEKINVIYACMADKDVKANLEMLKKRAKRFVFTTVKGNPRAMKACALCAYAKEHCDIDGMTEDCLWKAIETAAGLGGLTVICGSLYLYGDLPTAVIES